MESTFLKLKDNERAIRKKVLMNAAMKLFSDKSFQEIGMRDIATEAGVSAASIYRYFESKDDLFVEAFRLDIKKIQGLLENLRVSSVEDFVIKTVDYMYDQESTFLLLCHFLLESDESSEAIKKFQSVHFPFLKDYEKRLKNLSGEEFSQKRSEAFFASLAGVVMMFRRYPGLDREERRKLIHKAALVNTGCDGSLY